MAKIIAIERVGYGNAVIGIDEGETFFANFMTPEGIENFTEVEQLERGSTRIKAKAALIMVVEGLHESKHGCKHIRFVRFDRRSEGAHGLNGIEEKKWPRLRAALCHCEVSRIHAQGGFGQAVAYSDEMAVPDYSMSGSWGWIVKRNDIEKYLDALPPLKDSGEIGMVWINHVGWMNTPDECHIVVVDHDPTNDEVPIYHDRPRGCEMSCNHQIFRVEYDKGSRLVKRIINQSTSKDCPGVGYKVQPVARYIEVGKRLPR